MEATEGLVRGQPVKDTGSPIMVTRKNFVVKIDYSLILLLKFKIKI